MDKDSTNDSSPSKSEINKKEEGKYDEKSSDLQQTERSKYDHEKSGSSRPRTTSVTSFAADAHSHMRVSSMENLDSNKDELIYPIPSVFCLLFPPQVSHTVSNQQQAENTRRDHEISDSLKPSVSSFDFITPSDAPSNLRMDSKKNVNFNKNEKLCISPSEYFTLEAFHSVERISNIPLFLTPPNSSLRSLEASSEKCVSLRGKSLFEDLSEKSVSLVSLNRVDSEITEKVNQINNSRVSDSFLETTSKYNLGKQLDLTPPNRKRLSLDTKYKKKTSESTLVPSNASRSSSLSPRSYPRHSNESLYFNKNEKLCIFSTPNQYSRSAFKTEERISSEPLDLTPPNASKRTSKTSSENYDLVPDKSLFGDSSNTSSLLSVSSPNVNRFDGINSSHIDSKITKSFEEVNRIDNPRVSDSFLQTTSKHNLREQLYLTPPKRTRWSLGTKYENKTNESTLLSSNACSSSSLSLDSQSVQSNENLNFNKNKKSRIYSTPDSSSPCPFKSMERILNEPLDHTPPNRSKNTSRASSKIYDSVRAKSLFAVSSSASALYDETKVIPNIFSKSPNRSRAVETKIFEDRINSKDNLNENNSTPFPTKIKIKSANHTSDEAETSQTRILNKGSPKKIWLQKWQLKDSDKYSSYEPLEENNKTSLASRSPKQDDNTDY